MKKRMHHFLGIALTTLGSCHLEGEAHAAPFFLDKERGWFWREVEPEPVKKTKPEVPQKVIASPTPTKEAPPAPLSVSWLRKHLGIYRDKAIDDPSPENIAAYFYLQRVMMDKAHRFTDVAHEVVLSDPGLDENTRRPIATFGAQEANRLATRTSDESLSLIAQSTGILFFFRSDCSYCHLQAPLLRILEERYGFKVFPVSLDGMGMPGDLYQDFTIDQGQAARLGIQSTPALFLLNPPAKVIPLSQGVLSLDELTQRILMLAHTEGLLTDEIFDQTRGQKRIPSLNLPKSAGTTTFPSDPKTLVNWLRNGSTERVSP